MILYSLIIILGYLTKLSFENNLYLNDFLLVDYPLISNSNRTVNTSITTIIAPCSCDLTPTVCDAYCCCDTDCPSYLTASWKSNSTTNLCKNINKEDFYSIDLCKSAEWIYDFNTNVTLVNYKSTLNNILCIYYDNTGDKGLFYNDANTIPSSQILTLYQQYINHPERYYYSSMNTGVNFGKDSNAYAINDYIRVRQSISSAYEADEKIFFPASSDNGICEQRDPLIFLNNKENQCSIVLNTLSSAVNYNWKDNAYLTHFFAQYPSNSSPYIKMNINSIYVKDYNTGIIQEITFNLATGISDLVNTEVVINTANGSASSLCTCNYFLHELHKTFVLNTDLTKIQSIQLDIVLLSNISGLCNSRKIIKQKHVTTFSTGVNINKRSGNPGYINGQKLLIAKRTALPSSASILSAINYPFSVSGRDLGGNCYNITSSGSTLFNSIEEENTILFNRNLEYACTVDIPDIATYANMCNKSTFASYYIYSQLTNIQYLGIYGSSDIGYFKDWIVLNVPDLTSSFNSTDYSCIYPSAVELNILTTKAGNIDQPQVYIVTANFNIIKTKINYYDSLDFPSSLNKRLQFRIRVNYIPLNANDFTQTSSSAFIIPLPINLSNPFQ